MTTDLDPGELIAQLPYALGFYPATETVVVVSDTDRRRLWDFPPDRPAVDVAATIAAACDDDPQLRVTPVVYAGRVDFAVEIDATDLATALSAHFPHVDAPLMATPDGWRHAVDCPGRCCTDGGSLNPVTLPADLAHAAATTWPTPMATRTDLADYFTTDPMQRTLVAAARTTAARQQRAMILSPGGPPAWRRAATEQAWAHLTSVRALSPTAAARTLLQLQDTYVADAILMRIQHSPSEGGSADRALTALRELCRSAPDDLAPAALSTWAHAAASRGDVPRAMAAISRTQQLTPRHHPTSVLQRLLIDGVDPADLAAVRLPEDSLLNTADPISPAVVSGAGPAGPPQAPPPSAGPPPPTPGRTR